MQKLLDKEAAGEIRLSVIALLNATGNEELFGLIQQFSENKSVGDLTIGDLMSILTRSVSKARGRLLVLVDEYDQPVREGLLRLIPQHGAGLYANVQKQYLQGLLPLLFRLFQGHQKLRWTTEELPLKTLAYGHPAHPHQRKGAD